MTEQQHAEKSEKTDSRFGLLSSGPSSPATETKGFNNVEEVKELYHLPRAKEKKSIGKSASCDFEAFKEGLYAPSALFQCFKTQSQRLPFWILAMWKLMFSETFGNKFDVNWTDKHGDKGQYIDIEIRVNGLRNNNLSYAIIIHLETNRITVQGQNYQEFVEKVFPEILELVNSLIAENDGEDHTTIANTCVERTTGKKFKSLDGSDPPQLGNQVSSTRIKDSQSVLSLLSNDIVNIQASLNKLNINDLLQTIIDNQNSINKRLNNMEGKIQASQQPSSGVSDNLLDHFKGIKNCVAATGNQLSKTVREDLKEVHAKNAEVSLLMKELDIKSNEISALKVKIKGLQSGASKLDSLEKEKESLRNQLLAIENQNNRLQKDNEVYQSEIDSLSTENRKLEEELIYIKSESMSVQKVNEVLSNQSSFLKDQILSKDKVIDALINNQKLSASSNSGERNQVRPKPNEAQSNQVLLMGDSIIKLVEPEKLLGRNPETKVSKVTAYTWDEAKEALSDPDILIPNHVVLHLGTNDIRDGKALDDILGSAKEAVQSIFNRNKEAKVFISSVIPRGDDANLEIERVELNLKLLKWSHEEEKIHLIDNSNLAHRGRINDKLYGMDKVHLNLEGSKILASNISFPLKEQLGLVTNQQVQGQRKDWRDLRRRGRRGGPYNGGFRQRSWSPS